jgi:hypothetical protein
MRFEDRHFSQCNRIAAHFISVVSGLPEVATSILIPFRILLYRISFLHLLTLLRYVAS